MGVEKSSAFCPYCDANVPIERQTPNHIMHLILSVVTMGLWLPVWFLVGTNKGSWRCSDCGRNLGGGSNGWGLAGSILAKKPEPPRSDSMKCPFCMETIKRGATLCKHCHSRLEATEIVTGR